MDEPKKELKVEWIPVKQLKFASYNPKGFNSKQFERLGQSIEALGWTSVLVYNEQTGNMIDGNQRLKYALSKGDPEYLVPCLKLNVDLQTEKKINIALNQTSTPVDGEKVYELLKDVGTEESLLANIMKDFEALEQKRMKESFNSEYEISKDVDEEHNYIVSIFDKGVDFANIETFFNMGKVYDPRKEKVIGMGRVLDGKKLLSLIKLANENGYKDIDQLQNPNRDTDLQEGRGSE